MQVFANLLSSLSVSSLKVKVQSDSLPGYLGEPWEFQWSCFTFGTSTFLFKEGELNIQ